MSHKHAVGVCVICGEPITAHNDSKEHVIPEAIGGRLCVRRFVHQTCNNGAGSTWDAELARQLLPLTLHFGAKRPTRPPRLAVKTTANEELLLGPLGRLQPQKPTITSEVTPQGIRYQIRAGSQREARRVLNGLKRKHPDIDVEKELTHAQPVTAYPLGVVHHQLDFGGPISGRSVVKSVMAIAHKAKIPQESCAEAISYLRESDADPCFGYYYVSDLLTRRPAEMPLHCIAVSADPETGLVLGYAEYFGFRRVVLCLGRGYRGKRIEGVYAVDPRDGSELSLRVGFPFSERDIAAIYAYEMIPDGSIEAAFSSVFSAALQRQHEAERERIIGDAVNYAFANCGAKYGDFLTEEQLKTFSGLIGQKITPWIIANVRRRYRSP